MSVLEQLEVADARRTEQAEGEFHRLVVAFTTNEEPAAENVHRVLTAANKSTADLRNAISIHKQRAAKRKLRADANAGESERSELQNKIRLADAEFAKAQRAHREVVWPLQARIENINQIIVRAATVNSELINTCPDASLCQRRSQLHHESLRISAQIDRATSQLADREALLAHAGDPDQRTIHTAHVEQARAALLALQTKATELEAEGDSLLQEMIEA